MSHDEIHLLERDNLMFTAKIDRQKMLLDSEQP